MSFKRVMIAALVAAAAVPAPAAFATYVDNPGPRAAGDTSPTRRVLRDHGAHEPPPVVAATHGEPAGGFPWADAAIPAGLVVLIAAGAGIDRRRRAAA